MSRAAGDAPQGPSLRGFGTVTKLARRAVRNPRSLRALLRSVAEDVNLYAGTHLGATVIRQKHMLGLDILLRVDEAVGRAIYFHESYEPCDVDFLAGAVRQSDVCFDVGCNIGFFTLLMARGASRGHVHAFDPIRLNTSLTVANAVLNGFQNVTANCCALADRVGEASFVHARDSAFSSLVDTKRRPSSHTVLVPVQTLDAYCENAGVRRIDILKIDVEGAEAAVLAGARRILSDPERRPRLILMEVFDSMLRRQGSSTRQVVGELVRWRYSPQVATGTGLVEFDAIAHADTNVLFLAPP